MNISRPIRVLYIDDSPVYHELVKQILAQRSDDFLLTQAASWEEFEVKFTTAIYDLVLTDFHIHAFNGLQILDRIRAEDPNLPVIILTGTGSEETAVETLKRGVSDYVIKSLKHIQRLPYTIEAVIKQAETQAQQQRLLEILEATPDFIGTINASGQVTYLNQAALRLQGIDKANIPKLTIRDFHPARVYDILQREGIPTAIRNGIWSGETTLLAGDGREIPASQVLVAHKTSRGALSHISIFARDISESKRNMEVLREREQQLGETLATQIATLDALPAHVALLDGTGNIVSVNIGWRRFAKTNQYGIVLYPTVEDDQINGLTPGNELLKRADIALYEAKRAGRNTFCFYRRSMEAHVQTRMVLRQALHRALEREEFILHYQPQIDLATGKITGVEALLRWPHPELGMQRPDQFIPLAEESGLIIPIGEWVLYTACDQMKAWQRQIPPPIKLAVNISVVQIERDHLVETIQRILTETELEPNQLKLELTESVLALDSDKMLTTLQAINELGVGLAIDDFGTGYSSFRYLKIFPVDELKIDQTFVRELTRGSTDAAIVQAMIAVARSLELDVVAEGVETREQSAFLYQEGCNKAQGYYFSLPLLGEDMTFLLEKDTTLPIKPNRTN